jgi:protease I
MPNLDIQARVAVLVEDLFEDLELWYPVLRLREAGAQVTLIGLSPKLYHGKHGLTADPSTTIDDVKAQDFDALIIPGGYAPDRLRRNPAVLSFVKTMDQQGSVIGFICHAGWVLISAGILSGRRVTSYHSIRDDMINAGAEWIDAPVVVDGHLISSRNPSDLPQFLPAILTALQHIVRAQPSS